MSQFQQTRGTPKEIFRAIRIFFIAIISGALIFAIIALLINKTQDISAERVKGTENIFLVIGFGVTVVCLAIAWKGYNKGIMVAKDSLISLPDKLNHYRVTLIRYIALCEGPALLGVILFFIMGNYIMLLITITMIAAMLLKAPTRKRITDDLGLDWKQQQELE